MKLESLNTVAATCKSTLTRVALAGAMAGAFLIAGTHSASAQAFSVQLGFGHRTVQPYYAQEYAAPVYAAPYYSGYVETRRGYDWRERQEWARHREWEERERREHERHEDRRGYGRDFDRR